MGVDLALLPFSTHPDSGMAFSHNVIELERRRELWTAIEPIEAQFGRDVPEYFNTYLSRLENGERGYGDTQQTHYGDRLRYVKATHLKPLRTHPAVQDNWRNRAVWAYIEEMPDDWNIALYWS